MKNKDFIFTIIGLVLVLGLVIGLCVWVANSDKTPTEDPGVTDSADNGSDSDTNGGGTSTQKPSGGSATQNPSNSVSSFYESGDLGYITHNGVTTFYVRVNSRPTDGDGYDCADEHTIIIYPDNFIAAPGYTLACKFSIDEGETWIDFYNDSGDLYAVLNGDRVYLPLDKDFLVAYTEIRNCDDPLGILQDLKNKIFDDISVKDGCCEADHVYYTKFGVFSAHKAAPDKNGNIG